MSLRRAHGSFAAEFGGWRIGRFPASFARFGHLALIEPRYINLFNQLSGQANDLQSLAFVQREMLDLIDYCLSLYNTFNTTGRNADYV